MESHNQPLFRAQRPCWHSPLSNRCGISQSTLLQGPTYSLTHHSVFTPLRGLASSLAHHSVFTPLRGSASSLAHHSVFTPLRGSTSSLAHHLVFTPLRGLVSSLAPTWCLPPFGGSASSLAHRPVSDSNTVCNSPSPLLADIVLFGLSLLGFPSKILKRLC